MRLLDPRRLAPGPRRPVLGLALALPLLLACSPVGPDLGPPIEAIDVVQELLVDQDAWWVAEGEPEVGTISPSEYYKYDAADRISLILPPPAEVVVQAPEADGDLRFEFGAGVDRSTADLFPERAPGRFNLRLTQNGETVFDATISVYKKMDFEEAVWQRPEGGAILVSPGDELRLTTRQVGGRAVKTARVGFSGLQFVRNQQIERRPSDPGAPNIIYIVQDTMRWDRTTIAGAEQDLTPALARLAARGVRYSAAHATSSWTWPSTASLMTGLLPEAHGVISNESCVLPWGADTLAEVLQQRGYTTAAFARNPLIVPDKGFAQGFELFDSEREFEKTGLVMPDIEAWVREQGERRFFLYLHLADAHAPLAALASELERLDLDGITELTEEEIEERLGWANKELFRNPTFDVDKAFETAFPGGGIERVRELYDASVASGDTYLDELLDLLEELGLDDRTVVAFTSDHGEEWLEHGLIRHAHSLYRELVQVPLVLAGPDIPEGITIDAPVSNRGLVRTLARFGGAELETQGAVDLVELATAGVPDEGVGPVFFSTHHGFWQRARERKIFGVRDGDWMLKMGEVTSEDGGDELTFDWRLFDLANDPAQQVDVAEQHPYKADALRRLIEEKLTESDAINQETTGGLRVAASGATLEMLGDIGYLDGLEDE